MIRVVLVDDEILARLGLRTFLESEKDIRVEGEFSCAKDALCFLAAKGRADIVITDIEMAGLSGLELIRRLRQSNGAAGVIIVSCHDNFAYAKAAIAAGVDAYLLKQEISAAQLISAVRDIYAKKARDAYSPEEPTSSLPGETDRALVHAVGAFDLTSESRQENGFARVNEAMLLHLCESIVKQHNLGVLLHPFKHDPFFLFSFDATSEESCRREKIEVFARMLSDTVRFYTNYDLSLGVSEWFQDMKEVRDQFDCAQETVSLLFYQDNHLCRFYTDRQTLQMPRLALVPDGFLDEGGMACFRAEMHRFLAQCQAEQQPVSLVRQTLVFTISQFVWRVLQEYHFPDALKQRWNNCFAFKEIIDSSADPAQLEERLCSMVKQFQVELLTQLKTDEFQLVLQYIHAHPEQKLSLSEFADMSCMSITSFCRRFKQKTNMTLIQYINHRKIDEVRRLLAEHRTLEEIADTVGFLNVNYMIRVFKKIVGQTITEYRKTEDSKSSGA